MPKVSYNDPRVKKLYSSGFKPLKLESKNDSIKFILGDAEPTMFGLHWVDVDGKPRPYFCPRVVQEKECSKCNEGFDLFSDLKSKKLDKESKEYKVLHKKASDKMAKINFYYPVFVFEGSADRGAYVLEVTKTVFDRFGELASKKGNLMDLTFQLDRTEKPGSGYYSLDDINYPYQLTEEEAEELRKIAETDLESSFNYKSIDEYTGLDDVDIDAEEPESLDEFIKHPESLDDVEPLEPPVSE